MKIGRLLTDEDSLKVYHYFEGIFLGGTSDSLQIGIQEVQTNKVFTNGIKYQSTIPGRFYPQVLPGDSNSLKLALLDIDYLKIKSPKWQQTADAIVEPLIWVSFFTLILSPLISYNFKEGELNTERYKNWALASTAGLIVGFGSVIIINTVDGPRTFQFRTDWPYKNAKVWSFK